MAEQLSFMGRTKQLHLSLPPEWSGTTKHVTSVLFTFAGLDDGGGITASIETIAIHAGEPERTVQRVLRFLSDGGFLEEDGRFEWKDGTTTKPRKLMLARLNPMRKAVKERGVTYGTGANSCTEGVPSVVGRGAIFGTEGVPWVAPKPKSLTEESNREIQPKDSLTLTGEQPKSANEAFEAFWDQYPRKTGKLAARKSYDIARKKYSAAAILAGLAAAEFSDDPKFIPHPATWLNQGRWLDEPAVTGPSIFADPALPHASDPWGVRTWVATIRDAKNETIQGRPIIAVAGWDIVATATEVCEAAGIDPTIRIDLEPIAQWLRDGIDPDVAIEAVRTSKRPDRPNLRYYDQRVRTYHPRAA